MLNVLYEKVNLKFQLSNFSISIGMSFVNIPCVALKGSKKNQDAVVGVHGHTSQYNPSVAENTKYV